MKKIVGNNSYTLLLCPRFFNFGRSVKLVFSAYLDVELEIRNVLVLYCPFDLSMLLQQVSHPHAGNSVAAACAYSFEWSAAAASATSLPERIFTGAAAFVTSFQ